MLRWLVVLVRAACCVSISLAHEGPDPIAHWNFNARSLKDGHLHARLGPDATVEGDPVVVDDPFGQSLMLSRDTKILVRQDWKQVEPYLPKREMTVSAWVAVNQRQPWGGIVAVAQDNGGAEKGWVLGYDEHHFHFALASTGADDGDGRMTYLKGSTAYELGRFYHVVGVYDGAKMQLFVNGRLDGQSNEQSGSLLYPDAAPLVLGRYLDANEEHPHVGRLRDVAIYDLAAKPAWAAHAFAHQQQLVALAPVEPEPPEFGFAVKPYLQFVTPTGITVMWQTTRDATGRVHFGETAEVPQHLDGDGNHSIHEITLADLQVETQYFYRVSSTDADGATIESEVRTFQTANKPETPFAFAIISDTQDNRPIALKVSEMAWAQRPNFVLHPGDLVGVGTKDEDWTQEFFPSMEPLISRVALIPVLGNHERNARNYYDYMSLPAPEYYYEFTYGNAHFFMIDSNKKVGPDSEQYKWLDAALAKCTATWKFVCHHHPPYSSDENDYGDLWKTNKSTRGDMRVRQLAPLYDKHGVDIVWCGHIHSYERTWPLHGDNVTQDQGTIYMITGGGGGGLETAGPFKPYFQNNVRHGHHYCMVAINGGVLEFKAFDIENRLFDYMKVEK